MATNMRTYHERVEAAMWVGLDQAHTLLLMHIMTLV
jgi:hypothetical protein